MRPISHMECWVSKYEKKVCVEFISEGILENIQKMKFLGLTFLKRSNFEAFLMPSTLKTENFDKNLNGCICAYRVFYLPIFPYGTEKTVVLRRGLFFLLLLIKFIFIFRSIF